MCARLARNVRAQPPPGHGRGGPIPVPPARAASKPRDRGAEKRGSSCHKRKYHRCTASLAYVVTRLRDDGICAGLPLAGSVGCSPAPIAAANAPQSC
jgi:hypothetical protein